MVPAELLYANAPVEPPATLEAVVAVAAVVAVEAEPTASVDCATQLGAAAPLALST